MYNAVHVCVIDNKQQILYIEQIIDNSKCDLQSCK